MEVGDQIFSVNDEIVMEKKGTQNVINESGSFITLHLYKKGKWNISMWNITISLDLSYAYFKDATKFTL